MPDIKNVLTTKQSLFADNVRSMMRTQPVEETGYPDERQIRNPYGRRQQLRRIAWWVGELVLFRCSLRPMYGWRRWVLRMYGATLGDHVCIQRTAHIEFPWNLEMGRYSSIGENACIYSLGKVSIGEFAMISQRAFLCTGTHDYTRPQMPLITRPIVVGRGVWIAADVYVTPGITIGDNAVIGARSVVTKNMPANMVCVGHPCRPIKPRLHTESRADDIGGDIDSE